MNVDYVGITDPAVLIFSEDIQLQCVNISIIPDEIVERNELFTVTLESADTVTFSQSSAVVVIVDSDEGSILHVYTL